LSTAIVVSVFLTWALLIFMAYAIFVLYRQFGQQYLNSADGRADQGPKVGTALLSIGRTDVRGREVALPGTRPTLLLFSDVKCDLCSEIREQYDVVDPFADRISMVVFCTGPLDDVKAWSARTPEYVQVVRDERMAVADRYRVSALPFAIAVGSDGIVRAKSIINGREGLRWAAEQTLALPVADVSRPSEEVART
jgi:hypothetical protein